jgi:hypothetical protein
VASPPRQSAPVLSARTAPSALALGSERTTLDSSPVALTGTGFRQHTGDQMKTQRLTAVLIFVSVAATASALALAFHQDIVLATVLGCGGYVSTAATGLVIGAR